MLNKSAMFKTRRRVQRTTCQLPYLSPQEWRKRTYKVFLRHVKEAPSSILHSLS